MLFKILGGFHISAWYIFIYIYIYIYMSDMLQTTLRNQNISANLDDPEGGMDAVLQAILCEDVSTCIHIVTHCIIWTAS